MSDDCERCGWPRSYGAGCIICRVRERIESEMNDSRQPIAYDPGTCEADGLRRALEIMREERLIR